MIEVFDDLGEGGIIIDTPPHRLGKPFWSDGRNFRFTEDGARILPGNRTVFTEAEITPLWLQSFPPKTNPNWVYADLERVFGFQGGAHVELTREVGGNYSANPIDRWQSTVLNGVGVLNNGVDIPQAWPDFNINERLIDLPNWPADRRAKVIRSFKNFLVALNLTDSGQPRPYRVLWSHRAVPGTLPSSWDSTDPALDSRETDLAQTADHIVDCLPLGDINVIYKERSVWGMAEIGPPNFFRFWNILDEDGLLARDCVVATPMGHVFVTAEDVKLHNGQPNQAQSILDRKARKWMFQIMSKEHFQNSFAVIHPVHREVWICFPSNMNVYPDHAIVWNWTANTISIVEFDSLPFVASGSLGPADIDDLTWGGA